MLRGENLQVGYRRRGGARTVLADVDIDLRAGELTCLLGPNGSGKSTLLRTLAGMQPALSGQVFLDGEVAHRLSAMQRARRLAVVLTDQIDVGMLRVEDLVALGRHPHTGWSGTLQAEDIEAVSRALAAVGCEPLRGRMVAQLSDGERQRVLIARALAQSPTVLALDEPIAFVDVPRRVELTGLLRRLARETGMAVLLTTHDIDLALRSADRLWLIGQDSVGAARLLTGAPEDLVLSGAVARAFATDEVTFDVERAAFLPLAPARGRARVHGKGAEAVWAARALERIGLAVINSDDVTAVEVTVLFQGGWGLEINGAWSEYGNIESLLDAVNTALLSQPAQA